MAFKNASNSNLLIDTTVLPSRSCEPVTTASLKIRNIGKKHFATRIIHQSLRHSTSRIIQTQFHSFLVCRSRTLRHLKHLAFIKSTFNSLKSSFSSHTHFDFFALSHKATNLLLELDSIEDCDPMIMDGKRSISRDLVQFLDYIEEVALKKHLHCVKTTKNVRSVQKIYKPRNSSDDEKRKLLHNLRARVDKISRLCKVSENEEGLEPEDGIHTNVIVGKGNQRRWSPPLHGAPKPPSP